MTSIIIMIINSVYLSVYSRGSSSGKSGVIMFNQLPRASSFKTTQTTILKLTISRD